MGRLRSPLIAVMKEGKLHGVITASRLLAMALKCGLTEQALSAVVTGLKTAIQPAPTRVGVAPSTA
jgi:hypothetical protein